MKRLIIAILILIGITAVLWAADGNQTVSITSSIERRNQEPLIKPVWEHVVTAVFDADDTTNVTQNLPINGILVKVILLAPDGANAVTYQVEIDTNTDVEIFDTGEQAEAANYTYNLFEPLSDSINVHIGPSGAIGDEQSIIVILRGI